MPPVAARTRQQQLENAHTILTSAVRAATAFDIPSLREDLDLLAEPEPGWRGVVTQVVLRHGDNALAGLWTRGWQPADLVRCFAKDSSRHAAAVLPTLLAHEAEPYRQGEHADRDWLAQLDEADARTWWETSETLLEQQADRLRLPVDEVLRAAVELLAVCQRLPPIPKLRPDPASWSAGQVRSGRATDEKLLSRVRALLDKAEATEFPDEAEALAGKAQELMTRYAIDASMLEAESSNVAVEARRIGIDDPYARQKVSLLSAVGRANRCEVIYSPGYGFCTVFGTSSDLELVELLHASLLLQATRAMLAAGTQRDTWGRPTTRSFRTSFLAAYAARIGQRLKEANRTVEVQAEQRYGSSMLPVLAARADAVRDLAEALLPHAKTMRAAVGRDGRGWSAGVAAANSADLGGQRLQRPRALES